MASQRQTQQTRERKLPYNLIEAMKGIYQDKEYDKLTQGIQPLIYNRHHYAWSFPSLMTPKLQ